MHARALHSYQSILQMHGDGAATRRVFFLMADGCDSRAISISIGPARCLFALLAS
jgi:hypothetical protein